MTLHHDLQDQVARARAVPIEAELARRGVQLRRQGRELVGPCPICGGDDRFGVNPGKQVFNCRGCGIKGGDAIELVRALDDVPFPEAVETLAPSSPRSDGEEWPKPNGAERPQRQEATPFLIGIWTYVDEAGEPLRQVRRFEFQKHDASFVLKDDGKRDKIFSQYHPDPNRPGKWLKGVEGAREVPYRLPELREAVAMGRRVVIVEGERKADLLWSWGIPATCNAEGAKNAKIWRELREHVRGVDIVIIPDNDPPGRKFADDVAALIQNFVEGVRVLELPGLGLKEDVVNWAARGGTREALDDLIDHEAKPWAPPPVSNGHDPNAEPGPLPKQAPALEILVRCASEISPERIDWLWSGFLAKGKLHLIGGVPEAGKTTIGLSFAAANSAGSIWPDGTHAPAGNVLIWTSEDGVADTLVPRLIRMGADLSRIFFIEQARPPGKKSRPFNPATDLPALAEKAREIGGVSMLMLDPVVAVVPMTRNSHNTAETRNGMQPVVAFAAAINAAVVGIIHLSKGTIGKDPLERINGSGAFGALPRIVLFAMKNMADEGEDAAERIMVRVKNNIGRSGGGFSYHIDAAPLYEQPEIIGTRVVWEHPLEGTARELLAAAENENSDANASRLEIAKAFLKDFLSKGERPQKEIETEAGTQGISVRTLKRASNPKEGVVMKRKAGVGGWFWGLK